MAAIKWMSTILLMSVTLICGSCDNSTDSGSPAVSGKITAKAAGIQGQNGNTYSVAAYDYDWYPGATGLPVGLILTLISDNNFSSTEALHPFNVEWNITSEEKVFDAKTYSVVFFVSKPDAPPQIFAEVRVSVNGDVIANAPAWSKWVKTTQ